MIGEKVLETAPCTLCGSAQRTAVSHKGQFGLPTHVVVCMVCGFSYLDPRWTKERYDQFYREEYDLYYRPEVLASNDDRSKFAPISKVVDRLKERDVYKPFKAVLDLGSGMGHALTYLKERHEPDAQYSAIEPSPTCRAHLIQQGFEHLAYDVYSNWERPASGRYGLVIMRHVLEHFHEPLVVLQKARKVLKEDGLLYVAVPDAAYPTRPLRGHFFRVVHISYFTKHTLVAMLEMAGFEVVDVVAGDAHERHEVFAICRKGPIRSFIPDPAEAQRQLAIYRSAGRLDAYYRLKQGLVGILRRLKIID